MKLLYFYMKFLDDQGEAKPFRGLNEIELNLSAQDLFHYDSKNNRLERKRRTTPLPENFWVNEAVKDLDTPGHDPSKITNVNVIAGENGSGKSTVIQILIDLLDALYGTLTSRDRRPLSYHDPRPHRFLLLLEGETGQTKKDKHPLVWYLMDYSPQTTQQNSARLDNSYYKEGIKHLTFSFYDWSALYADAKSIEWKEKEQDLRARDEIKKLLTKTKVVYMTNTLNQRDFARHTSQEANQRLRDFFVYDCSLGATVGPDIAQFFPYEVYKQVKYIFDKGQHELLKRIEKHLLQSGSQNDHKESPNSELRIPRCLSIYPKTQQYEFKTSHGVEVNFYRGLSPKRRGRIVEKEYTAALLSALSIAVFVDNTLEYLHEGRSPVLPTPKIRGGISSLDDAKKALNEAYITATTKIIVISDNELFIPDNNGIKVLTAESSLTCVTTTHTGQVITGSSDNTLLVWDLKQQRCIHVLYGHKAKVTCIAALSDGTVLSGSTDGTLRLWDITKGICLLTLGGGESAITCVASLQHGQVVCGLGNLKLQVWDIANRRCLWSKSGHSGWINCVASLQGGRTIVSGSSDKTLRIWDAVTGQCVQTLVGHSEAITCVDVLQNGRVVSGSNDQMLKVWDIDNGDCIGSYSDHHNRIDSVAVLPDGRVLSCAKDSQLLLWDSIIGTDDCGNTSTDGICQRIYLDNIHSSIFHFALHHLDCNDSFPRGLKTVCERFINFVWSDGLQLLSHFTPLPDESGYSIDIEGTIGDEIIYDLLTEFIEKYRYMCEPNYSLDFDWGLSSGEENMLRLFSNLYHVFDRDYNNPIYGPYAIYNNEKHRPFRELTEPCDTVLLFMDEADLTLHPEWQRRLIHLLTAFLPRIYPAPMTKELQLLLTTHSPLLLGDIPKENVTYLTSGGQVISSEEKDENSPGESFGQNIHTLLRQSFFLRDGTVGEFAAAKINATAAGLQKIIEEKACSSPEEMETLRRTVALTAPGILRAELERLLREAELALQPEQQFPIEQLLSTVNHLTPHQRAELLEALEREGNQ